jgi:hypothetical protein
MKAIGRLKFGAKTYQVFVLPDADPRLEGHNGLTNHDDRTIYISAEADLLEMVVHESLHAFLHETGLLWMLLGHIDDREKRLEAEEHAIRVATPNVIDLVNQLRRPGWARRLGKCWEKKS